MKEILRKIFSPILKPFENGNEEFAYKPANRKILVFISLLFWFLCGVVVYFSKFIDGYGFLIPAIVFFSVGFVTFVVGTLGSDRAIAKIWGNR